MYMIRQIRTLVVVLLSALLLSLPSCRDEDVVDNIYTFTEQTMGQYLEEDENLSEFAALLQRAHVDGLLKAYGEFTCFAPDNQAMKAYYEKKGKTSLDDFSADEFKTIAYDHLINGNVVLSTSFIDGRLRQQTMGDRYVSISYNDNKIYVNNTSLLYEKDVEVHNGVIHKIASVIDPTRFGIVEVISSDEKFSLFYQALVATGLSDSLMRDVDKTYDPNLYTSLIVKRDPNWRWDEIPLSKKYGYTVFMESNETMNEKAGITDLASMQKYAAEIYDKIYPEDAGITDITNRKNSLNRFIAYHLINKEMSLNKLIDAYDNYNQIKTCNMYEYLEPYCPNSLIEIKKDRATGQTNLINFISKNWKTIHVTANYDNDASNGVYHEIDDMLVYDEDVYEEHAGKRLRFDTASLFPELTNNNFRGYLNENPKPCPHIWFPRGYLERVESSERTTLGYVQANSSLMNYQGDEIFMDVSGSNPYDFKIVTPPVPKGVYEVRIGYLTNYARGVCQFYFDNLPAGVPVNLNYDGNDVSIGWKKPSTDPTDPQGFENDKMMRNQGYMKGPACFTNHSEEGNGRTSARALRKILGIYEFKGDTTHIISAKGLSSGQFMLDYIEFVPTSVIEFEDIY